MFVKEYMVVSEHNMGDIEKPLDACDHMGRSFRKMDEDLVIWDCSWCVRWRMGRVEYNGVCVGARSWD